MREKNESDALDEIIIWPLPRRLLGVAVPFKNGYAISGSGELGLMNELKLMYKAYLIFAKLGLNHPGVKQIIKKY